MQSDNSDTPTSKRDLSAVVPDSDLANCDRFIRWFGDSLLHVPERGWYFWNGEIWKPNAEPIAVECAKDTVRLLIEECMSYKGEQAKLMFKWAKASQHGSRIRQIVSLAESDDRLRMPITTFDADPWVLNCQGHIVNLKNGFPSQHDPNKYCSRQANVKYGQALNNDSLWFRFLDDITGGNNDLKLYLQRLAGYCLTGAVSEKAWFFCYGTGDNGKSVFIEVLHDLLGSYAIALNTQTLIKQRYGNTGVPNDVARLHGPRLATVSETGKGEEWNDNLLKDLTGGDIITARFLREEFFDFRPQCKLIVRGNNKPNISDFSSGMWRRLHLIPFEAQIPIEKQDKYLREKIVRQELSGVLTWALEGCIKWQEIGLAAPDSVVAAVQGYRDEMDIVGMFLAEKTKRVDAQDTKASVLYSAYKDWCIENGYKAINQTAFGVEMGQRNYFKVRNKFGWHYSSITVHRSPDGEQSAQEYEQ